jgi:hypothetical protein
MSDDPLAGSGNNINTSFKNSDEPYEGIDTTNEDEQYNEPSSRKSTEEDDSSVEASGTDMNDENGSLSAKDGCKVQPNSETKHFVLKKPSRVKRGKKASDKEVEICEREKEGWRPHRKRDNKKNPNTFPHSRDESNTMGWVNTYR